MRARHRLRRVGQRRSDGREQSARGALRTLLERRDRTSITPAQRCQRSFNRAAHDSRGAGAKNCADLAGNTFRRRTTCKTGRAVERDVKAGRLTAPLPDLVGGQEAEPPTAIAATELSDRCKLRL